MFGFDRRIWAHLLNKACVLERPGAPFTVKLLSATLLALGGVSAALLAPFERLGSATFQHSLPVVIWLATCVIFAFVFCQNDAVENKPERMYTNRPLMRLCSKLLFVVWGLYPLFRGADFLLAAFSPPEAMWGEWRDLPSDDVARIRKELQIEFPDGQSDRLLHNSLVVRQRSSLALPESLVVKVEISSEYSEAEIAWFEASLADPDSIQRSQATSEREASFYFGRLPENFEIDFLVWIVQPQDQGVFSPTALLTTDPYVPKEPHILKDLKGVYR